MPQPQTHKFATLKPQRTRGCMKAQCGKGSGSYNPVLNGTRKTQGVVCELASQKVVRCTTKPRFGNKSRLDTKTELKKHKLAQICSLAIYFGAGLGVIPRHLLDLLPHPLSPWRIFMHFWPSRKNWDTKASVIAQNGHKMG